MTKEEFVVEALNYLGYPSMRYQRSDRGCDEIWFDCSGFVTFLLKKLCFPNPLNLRHCNEYFDLFGIFIYPQYVQEGDLVFFSRRGIIPTHMGIMVSLESYIHAPGKDGTSVMISPIVRELIQPPQTRDDLEARVGGTQKYVLNPIGFKRPAIKKGRFAREIS